MTLRHQRGNGAGILGVGAAACLACCAGPILGVIGAIGLASTLVVGVVGLLVVVAAVMTVAVARRRRVTTCGRDPGPVPVELGRIPPRVVRGTPRDE